MLKTKRIKKPVSILLALLLLLSVAAAAPITANASAGWNYKLNSAQNGIIITGYTGTDTNVTIPSTIDNLPVKLIDYGAFMNNTDITAVTIPSGVTQIGYEVFKGCSNLEYVSIPDTVTSIGDAFKDCTSLEGIVIPPSVTSIHSDMFDGCTHLRNLTINGGLFNYSPLTTVTDLTVTGTEIPTSNYSGWTCLQRVTISDTVTSIGMWAFKNDTQLRSVTIGSGVTNIAIEAFLGCTALTSITIPSNVTTLTDGAFSGCTNLVTANIQANISVLNGRMFQSCTSLTNVTIPNSVNEVKETAFSGCSNITHMTVPGDKSSTFRYDYLPQSTVTDLTVTGTSSIPQYRFSSFSNLERVTVGGSITGVEYSAFGDLTSLTTVTLGSSVATIAVAFSGCTNLESLTILNRNATINDYNARGTNLPSGDFTLYGYADSTTETFAYDNGRRTFNFVPIFDANTGGGTAPATLDDTMTAEDDDNGFGINQNSYKNIELLGVQQKTDAGTNDMRFIAVINQGLVAQIAAQDGDITDYGFVVAKCSATSTAAATEINIQTVTKGSDDTTFCSCKNTSNNMCGDYGVYDDTSTKYKYVTMAIKDVPDNQGFVVRFYVETSSGRTYYANYNTLYTGCATSYSNITQLHA